jgi:polysaccharide biosynthesis transport protein
MLETLNPNMITAQGELTGETSPKTLVHFVFGIIQRQLWIILSCLLIGSGCGALYLYSLRPTFLASATVMIDSRQGGIQQKSVLGDTPSTDSAWIDSQIGMLVLERGTIGQSVAEQLHLGSDPQILSPNGALGGDWIAPVAKLLSRGGSNSLAGLSEEQLTQVVAGAVAGGLEVKRVGFSYLLNVNFSSHSPEQAVKIANAAADAYVVAEMKAKYAGLRQASNWLQERYQTLRDQASAAERAAVEFKTKHNIVTAGGSLINDRQLTDINDRVGAARAKIVEEQSRLDQIEAVIKQQEISGTFDSTVPDALLNPIVTRLRSQYLDIMNKEADWSKRFGPNHQAVVNLRNQARDIRTSTHEELKRIAESYRSDLEISRASEADLRKQLTATVSEIPNDAQITLHALEATAQSYRTFYDNFFLNYTESIQQQSSPIPETRVVSYAKGASQSNPSSSRTMMLSILGGIAVGFGLGVLREAMDGAFRTGTEVRAAFRLECLALIPAIKFARGDHSSQQRLISDRRQSDELVEIVEDAQIINASFGALRSMVDAPFSQFAESIRALKMAADLREKTKPGGKVIGVTSSIPREGKSTVATALAALASQVGAHVLLIDCDLRNPSLTQSLAPHAASGLVEVLSGQQSLESTIWMDLETGLDFLPAVNVSRLANTDQILGGNAMVELFRTLRKTYDYIIVDLSPLLPVVDVRATTGLVDFYIFLIEWGQTKSDVVYQALSRSQIIYSNILGFTLNKVNMNVIGRYEGDHVRYYSTS